MVGLIILGVIIAIIVAIMLVPVGADVAYEGGKLRLSAKVCGVLLQLIPKPPADETKPKKEKKPKKPKKQKKRPEEQAQTGEEKPKKKLNLDFSMDEIMGLVKSVLRGLGRFGRKLSVDRFLLHYTAAGKDPYNTAMTFGYVNGALTTLAPICRRSFDAKDVDVWTDVDFTTEKTKVDFGVALTIRIGQIFGVVFTILFGALGILIKHKFRKFKEKRANKKAGIPDNEGTAAENKEEITKTIQAEERTDSNGEQ
ncbi:MAG: hypothetical protein SPI09_06795 [Candidatus Limivicinus sp.]|nr:hypothetical protein [Clostridiales bacterium]MDY6133051.1 hypothetical protein [Candidatus Limivicinus sp.]